MLSDDKFLTVVPTADEPRPDFTQALRGVGDKLRREASDFYLGFTGTPLPSEQDGPFKIGDIVEYVTPDGVRRAGSLQRPYSEYEWLVQVDEGESHIVPQVELMPSTRTPRHARREELQHALSKTSSWTLRRHVEAGPNDTKLLTLDVGAAPVTEDQVMAYTAQRGLQAVDMAREGNLLRVTAIELPLDSPSEPARGDTPGLDGPLMDGTGFPEGKEVWSALEAAGYELGAEVDDGDRIVRSYTVPHRYLTADHRVTATLHEGAAPLTGHFEYDPKADTMRRFVYTAEGTVEAPYSSGAGPMSVREDYPGGFEDGDYVVKAKDKTTDRYYERYYGPYGKQLVRNIPRRRGEGDELATFTESAGREPTDEEREACRRVLASYDGYKSWRPTRVGFVHKGQMVPAKDIVVSLMQAGAQNPDLQNRLNKVVMAEIGRDPEAFLGSVDNTIYPRILYGALQGAQGRKLLRLYRDHVPEAQRQAPDFGSPELFAERPSPEEAAHRYLTEKSPEYGAMQPGAQQQMIQQLLADPPQDLDLGQGGTQVVVPEPQRRRPRVVDERRPPLRQRVRERMPGTPEHMERQVRKVEGVNRQKPLGFQVRPKLDRVTSQGTYLCVRLVWDPEDCEGMGEQNIRHHVETWMKGLTTLKEQYPDLGFIGRPAFKTFDPDVGMAELLVRSTEGRNYPRETHEVEGDDNTTQA